MPRFGNLIYRRRQEQRRQEKIKMDEANYRNSVVFTLKEQVSGQEKTIEQNETHHANELSVLKKQLCVGKTLNRVTGIASVIGVGTLVVLISTLRDAKQATIFSNRAFILPTHPELVFARADPANGPIWKFRIPLQNGGNTPARDVVHVTQWAFAP